MTTMISKMKKMLAPPAFHALELMAKMMMMTATMMMMTSPSSLSHAIAMIHGAIDA